MKFINFLIKPASGLCNLRCKYCFYEDETEKRIQKSMGVMSQETVDVLLSQAFSAIEPGGTVSFAFQGGEPTIAGLDFFWEFVRKARAQCPERVRMSFAIQTNGTLLDDQWAQFFAEEHFLAGISIDGFKDLHDLNRVEPGGDGSWKKVMRGLDMLKSRQVDVNALCVVTGRCARSPGKVYRELKKLGFRYIQFIACLDPIGAERGTMPYSLTPEAYGKFLCGVFDLWYEDWKSGNYHSVRLFDDYVHILLGDGASTCATCGTCGAYFVVEADGSVYPCDFYVLDDWRMGKLGDMPLDKMAACETANRFLQWGQEKPVECAGCRWKKICNGGCKNDWERRVDGNHNYYCKAFQMLLEYGYSRFMTIVDAERAAMRWNH